MASPVSGFGYRKGICLPQRILAAPCLEEVRIGSHRKKQTSPGPWEVILLWTSFDCLMWLPQRMLSLPTLAGGRSQVSVCHHRVQVFASSLDPPWNACQGVKTVLVFGSDRHASEGGACGKAAWLRIQKMCRCSLLGCL